MAIDDVREVAKAEIRHRTWASLRGKATRTYIREHPELAEEYEQLGRITVDNGDLPEYVTTASLRLELAQRARRRENTAAAREWAQEHPEEAAKIKAEVSKQYGISTNST